MFEVLPKDLIINCIFPYLNIKEIIIFNDIFNNDKRKKYKYNLNTTVTYDNIDSILKLQNDIPMNVEYVSLVSNNIFYNYNNYSNIKKKGVENIILKNKVLKLNIKKIDLTYFYDHHIFFDYNNFYSRLFFYDNMDCCLDILFLNKLIDKKIEIIFEYNNDHELLSNIPLKHIISNIIEIDNNSLYYENDEYHLQVINNYINTEKNIEKLLLLISKYNLTMVIKLVTVNNVYYTRDYKIYFSDAMILLEEHNVTNIYMIVYNNNTGKYDILNI